MLLSARPSTELPGDRPAGRALPRVVSFQRSLGGVSSRRPSPPRGSAPGRGRRSPPGWPGQPRTSPPARDWRGVRMYDSASAARDAPASTPRADPPVAPRGRADLVAGRGGALYRKDLGAQLGGGARAVPGRAGSPGGGLPGAIRRLEERQQADRSAGPNGTTWTACCRGSRRCCAIAWPSRSEAAPTRLDEPGSRARAGRRDLGHERERPRSRMCPRRARRGPEPQPAARPLRAGVPCGSDQRPVAPASTRQVRASEQWCWHHCRTGGGPVWTPLRPEDPTAMTVRVLIVDRPGAVPAGVTLHGGGRHRWLFEGVVGEAESRRSATSVEMAPSSPQTWS